MLLKKKFFPQILGVLLLIGGLLSKDALSQNLFPSKPVRIIVGFGAGGSGDLVARAMAAQLGTILGQPVLVENRPGGAGMPSAEFVAKSNPDGYTILQYTTTLAVNTVLQKAVPYDLFEDFTPLALACEAPLVLITPGISSNRKLTDLIEYAKSKPNGVAFGHGGVGSMSHLASELLKRSLGFEAVSVPYKGNAPAMNDLIGGRLDYYFSTISDVLPNIRSGNLNALATTSELRDRSLPNVPTMVELGYKDFTPVVTWGYLAPKNIPAAAARQLQDAILKAMNTPSVRDRLESVSATARYAAGAEALTSRMRAEIDRWKPVIKSAGISPN